MLSLGACALLAVACTEDAEFTGVDTAGTGGVGSPNAGAPSNAGAAKGGSSGTTGTAGTSQGGKPPMGGASNAGTGGSMAGSTHAGTGGNGGVSASGGEGGSSSEGGSSGEAGAGGDGGASPGQGGAGGDGGSGGEGGAGPIVSCEVAQYTTAVPTLSQAVQDGDKITLTMRLQADLPRDIVELELNDGNGTFSAGLKPGTYEIKGDDLDLKYCNLCVRFYDRRNEFGGDKGWYMATGGMLTLTSVEDDLIGALTNVTFVHSYQENSGHSIPWEDGCTTKIDKIEFDTEIIPD